jgi:tetratricopeptide (TPR) repeat protein
MNKIIFFILVTAGFATHAQNASAIVAEADAEAEKGNHSRAVSLYSKAIFYEPSNAKTYYQRAVSYNELQDNEHTLEDYNKVIEIDPKFTEAYISRGFMLTFLGNSDAALEDCNKGLACVKDDQKPLKDMLIMLRGTCAAMKKQYDDAIPDLQYAFDNIQLENVKAKAIENIAKIYVVQKKHDKAIETFEKLIKLYPTIPDAYQQLAFEYGEVGQYQKAIEMNDKALIVEQQIKRDENGDVIIMDNSKFNDRGNNRIAFIYNNRGYAKHKLGKNAEALDDINRSIGIYPDNSYAFRNRALVNIALHDTAAACVDITESLKLGFAKDYGDEVTKLKAANCK